MTHDNDVLAKMWGYPTKDLWYDFKDANPGLAKAIMTLFQAHCNTAQQGTDSMLTSRGYHMETQCLRMAYLLGYVDVDWASVL